VEAVVVQFIKRGSNGGDQTTQLRIEQQSQGARQWDSKLAGNTTGSMRTSSAACSGGTFSAASRPS